MKIKYIVLCLLLALVGCQRDEEMEMAWVKVSNEVIEPRYESVRISSTISSNATIDNVVVILSTTPDFSLTTRYTMEKQPDGKYHAAIANLTHSTTYYVRYQGSNQWSSLQPTTISEFRTTDTPSNAFVTTSQVTDISYYSATVGGKVTDDGDAEVTERGICYSTSANPTTANTKITSGSGLGEFTYKLTDLQDGTIYYVRAYAVNEKGTSYGEQVSFTTKAKTIATIITKSATNVSYTSAAVGGNVTDNGGLEVTERGVVYSTNQNPTTANNKVTNGSGFGEFTCNLTDLQDGVTYYVRAYAVNEKGTAYGDEVSFTTTELKDGEEIENGYVYVDLGLSVKWATMNVGASSPEDYGDYFAWGETSTKSTYNWSTYKWCNGSSSILIKYNTSSSYGTVDNKTTLELSDDAARANWGGSWRMPTYAELTELCEQCTQTWTTQNGVNGYKVTSKSNGNSIFLPAAGYRLDSSLNNAGSYGYYWSSSLSTDDPYFAWNVYFHSGFVLRYYSLRNYGRSVRPVCP